MDTPKAGRSKRARAIRQLTATELFFYDNAGFSYNPKTQTAEQGRLECAKHYARAEEVAARLGWVCEWDWDESPDLSWMTEEEQRQEHEVLCCRVVDPEDRRHSLASLCGITDPDTTYRRVVEAELFSEALYHYDREIELLDAH